MEARRGYGPQDLIDGNNENEALLSEDALRLLSKSLTGLIPNNVDSVEDDALAYAFHKQTGEGH